MILVIIYAYMLLILLHLCGSLFIIPSATPLSLTRSDVGDSDRELEACIRASGEGPTGFLASSTIQGMVVGTRNLKC